MRFVHRVLTGCVLGATLLLHAETGQAVPIDPATLSPLLHLRAEQGVFTDLAGSSAAGNGNVVRNWADQGSAVSPATNDLAVGRLPVFESSGFGVNNRPALRFDGTDDFLYQALNLSHGSEDIFCGLPVRRPCR